MEKINFPSEREQEFRPFNNILFRDEYNSEMIIFDDYFEPDFDDLKMEDNPEEDIM